jgi:hypothetical protein
MFMMKTEMVSHLYWVMILFKVFTKKFVKDGASQFLNFHVNYHKFHALFSTRLSQLDYAITSFAQAEFQKCSQFLNFRVNFYKFNALFCTRLSQLD